MKTVSHPTLPWTVTFDPDSHSYVDNENRTYVSGTGLKSQCFAQFDEDAAAAKVAADTGRLEFEIQAEWAEKRNAAADYGTKVHEYAEAVIAGTALPKPATEQERRAFAIVDAAVKGLAAAYEFIATEQIIFDPLYRVAGTVDLLARNRRTGALAVLDWKTCESITTDSYGKFALPPLNHVPDSKYHHYAMQLSIYAWLITHPEYTAYPTKGEPVELALIHIPHVGDTPVWRPVPYLVKEAGVAVLRHYDATMKRGAA